MFSVILTALLSKLVEKVTPDWYVMAQHAVFVIITVSAWITEFTGIGAFDLSIFFRSVAIRYFPPFQQVLAVIWKDIFHFNDHIVVLWFEVYRQHFINWLDRVAKRHRFCNRWIQPSKCIPVLRWNWTDRIHMFFLNLFLELRNFFFFPRGLHIVLKCDAFNGCRCSSFYIDLSCLQRFVAFSGYDLFATVFSSRFELSQIVCSEVFNETDVIAFVVLKTLNAS